MNTIDNINGMRHSSMVYEAIRNHINETNDFYAYIYILQNFLSDIPCTEIVSLINQAHENLEEADFDKVIKELFKNLA